MTKANVVRYRCLAPADEAAFGQVSADARAGLSRAIDLILIHNERDVRGNQPRATLNQLTVLLAVAAWERFIVDIAAIARDAFVSVGVDDGGRGAAYFSAGPPSADLKPGPALQLLSALSGGRLPDEYQVLGFDGWVGTRPTRSVVLTGTSLADEVDAAIRLRNKIAHRALPQDELRGPRYRSDAEEHTIQAGWARIVAALFVQLIDQTAAVIAANSGFGADHRLPAAWFAAQPGTLRGVTEPGPLWGGWRLTRLKVERPITAAWSTTSAVSELS